MKYKIRMATERDAKAVHDIYGAYVPLDYVTFTVENPDVESYRLKIKKLLKNILFLLQKQKTGRYLVIPTALLSALTTHINGMWNGPLFFLLTRRKGVELLLPYIRSFHQSSKSRATDISTVCLWIQTA